jgi:hypothetical protein
MFCIHLSQPALTVSRLYAAHISRADGSRHELFKTVWQIDQKTIHMVPNRAASYEQVSVSFSSNDVCARLTDCVPDSPCILSLHVDS